MLFLLHVFHSSNFLFDFLSYMYVENASDIAEEHKFIEPNNASIFSNLLHLSLCVSLWIVIVNITIELLQWQAIWPFPFDTKRLSSLVVVAIKRKKMRSMQMYRVKFVLFKISCYFSNVSFVIHCRGISYACSYASIARMFCHHLESTERKISSRRSTTNIFIFIFKCIPNWKHSLVDWWWFGAFI